MKRVLSVALSLLLAFSLCACGEEESPALSQEELDAVKSEVEPIAKQFLGYMFSGEFVEMDELALVNFESFCKAKFSAENNEYGIYYKDGKLETEDGNFESVEASLEFMSQNWGKVVEQNIESIDFKYFPPEQLNEALENLNIEEPSFLPLDGIDIECAASVEFTVSVKLHYEGDDEESSYDNENAGLVTVFLIKSEGKWSVYSPSMAGLLFGFGYFK
ncbi:MAG: hypothetical protein E7550_01810 [Ruminococcaceae bacterium]|nr:hypothetical protein [Oscillospiraceae bacterium]